MIKESSPFSSCTPSSVSKGKGLKSVDLALATIPSISANFPAPFNDLWKKEALFAQPLLPARNLYLIFVYFYKSRSHVHLMQDQFLDLGKGDKEVGRKFLYLLCPFPLLKVDMYSAFPPQRPLLPLASCNL